jgi:hypothetical protein
VAGIRVLAVGACLALGACALAPEPSDEACRVSSANPDVRVCQRDGRITVMAAHGAAVPPKALDAAVREEIDASALPVARGPSLEVIESTVTECVAGPAADAASDARAQRADAVALACRLELVVVPR